MMELEMVHHLFDVLNTSLRSCNIELVSVTTNLPWLWLHWTQSFELDTIGDRLPLEVKHRMHSWDFNPPLPSINSFPHKSRVVASYHYELIAVLHVSVSEWDRRRFLKGSSLCLYYLALKKLFVKLLLRC